MSDILLSPKIAAILAGGKAKRFAGQDKGEIIISGERLIDIIHLHLIPQFDEILISGTHDYDLGFDVIPDADDAPGGPVGGVYSIWKILENRDIEGFFTVPVDSPNIPQNLLAALYSETNSAIAMDELGRHPTFGWWRLSDLSDVWGSLGSRDSTSLNRLADLVGAKNIAWEGTDAFANINTPVDLEKYGKHT